MLKKRCAGSECEVGERTQFSGPALLLLGLGAREERRPQQQPARIIVGEHQQDIGRDIIGDVFFLGEKRDVQHPHKGVPEFVQKHIGDRTDQLIVRGEPLRTVFGVIFLRYSIYS